MALLKTGNDRGRDLVYWHFRVVVGGGWWHWPWWCHATVVGGRRRWESSVYFKKI